VEDRGAHLVSIINIVKPMMLVYFYFVLSHQKLQLCFRLIFSYVCHQGNICLFYFVARLFTWTVVYEKYGDGPQTCVQ
jgi:hypothetical protein